MMFTIILLKALTDQGDAREAHLLLIQILSFVCSFQFLAWLLRLGSPGSATVNPGRELSPSEQNF